MDTIYCDFLQYLQFLVKTIGAGSYLAIIIQGAVNKTIDLWGLQLEAGSVATAFQTATGTIQGELSAAQRYYYLHASGTSKAIGNSSFYTNTDGHVGVKYPVEMRTAPTLVASTGANYYFTYVNGGQVFSTTYAIDNASPNEVRLYTTHGTATTTGFAGFAVTNNASSSIAFTSEL